LHHKFSDTDGDPHNANRGLFFSHIGWLMQRGHPEVFRRSKTIDMTDINNDPLVQFHTKYILYYTFFKTNRLLFYSYYFLFFFVDITGFSKLPFVLYYLYLYQYFVGMKAGWKPLELVEYCDL